MGDDVEEMTVSLTDMANMHAEPIKRADNLNAQLAVSVRREDAYKLELAAVKDDLAKSRIERANLRRSVNILVADVQEASADIGGAPQTAVKSLNRLSESIADTFEAKVNRTWKWILPSLDMGYATALTRIRASVVRDNDELLWSVARCTTLISSRLDYTNGALPVKGKADTTNARSGRPAEISEEVTADRDELTVE